MLARRGRFSRHCHVSTDEVNWQRASEFPELFAAAATPVKVAAAPAEEPAPRVSEPPAGQLAEPPPQATPQAEQPVEPEAAELPVEWFYAVHGEERGPVSADQIRMLLQAGALRADDFVWNDKLTDWLPAEQIPEFAGFLPSGVKPADGARHVSGMAVSSFVLGLLGTNLLFFLGSILAVVFGHLALGQIRDSGGAVRGRGLAIAGLILGYIIVISTVVVGIVLGCMYLLGDVTSAESAETMFP